MIQKIYYWEGTIKSCPCCSIYNEEDLESDKQRRVVIVDAGNGWDFNSSQLEYFNMLSNPVDYILITNQPLALDFDLVANRNIPNVKGKIYLFQKERLEWLPIEDFTDKELRFAHNILKMYLAGCFKENK